MPDNPSADERLARKVSLAQERDTRVVITRTVDTHRVLDIVRNADRGIRILRANLLIRFKPEDAVPLLIEYQKAIEGLHLAAAKICAMAGVPYRAPRGLEEPASADDSQTRDDKAADQAGAVQAGKEDKKKKTL
ncbi:MAG: hypothetical protein M0Z61_01220 [Nitrospiraceae bacterium]|nr:hypothetical protein [Nitrospiraceae bacterium]